MKKLSKIVALLLAGALTMLLFSPCGGGRRWRRQLWSKKAGGRKESLWRVRGGTGKWPEGE